jgi:rhodanese-related sulfurtransferase
MPEHRPAIASRYLRQLIHRILLFAGACALLTSMIPQTAFGALVSSILPVSRSGQVGDTLTAFANIINTGPGTATGCSISPLTMLPATFLYQTTDPATNALTGTPDTPIDIEEGAMQSFIIAFTPSAPFSPTDVEFSFDCTNTNPATTISGVNTLLLSATSTPVPDIIAIASGDGVVDIPAETGSAALAVATVNVGTTGSITASADTGSVELPGTFALCETDPSTAACINPTTPTNSATTTMGPGDTATFSVFLTGSGPIAFDPAKNRLFLRFTDAAQVVRGATSVALTSSVEDNPPPRFVVVTFNTGTTEELNHNSDGDDYGEEQAGYSNDYYGNGLAWVPAVEAVTEWIATLKPDIVVFQEIFYSGECPGIPFEAQIGFVCETWSPDDPTVVQVVLGSDYQVACHPGNSDKCLAVKKSFGSIRQCEDEDFCLEGLDGEIIQDCQSGARVARATIDLVSGGEITAVNVHGTSGTSGNDIDCRVQQVEQVFVNMDGEPGANGAWNVVMGDLNTDPERIPGSLDDSVAAWNDYVGGNQPFQWVSDDTPTVILDIPNLSVSSPLAIDHVISDTFTGSCYVPGSSDGYPAVYSNVYFDHRPQVCDIGDL